MKKTLILLLALSLICSCNLLSADKTNNDSIVIALWNVQNVFDGKDDGTEYEEYTKTGLWSDQLYKLRLKDIETVLTYGKLAKSNVIVLNEVENENVVCDIMSLKPLKNRAFKYYALYEGEYAIKTAVLSALPIEKVTVHDVEDARPVLQVQLENNIYILAVHGKSNREGVEETKENRLRTGKTLAFAAEKIQKEDNNALVVIAGDMNEDWTDENSMINAQKASGKFSEVPLIVSSSKYEWWYCFWLDQSLRLDSQGSYFYRGKWSCFDNILLSDAQNLVGAGVECSGILSKADKTPNAWNRDIVSGVSDHFPVWVEIKNNF